MVSTVNLNCYREAILISLKALHKTATNTVGSDQSTQEHVFLQQMCGKYMAAMLYSILQNTGTVAEKASNSAVLRHIQVCHTAVIRQEGQSEHIYVISLKTPDQ